MARTLKDQRLRAQRGIDRVAHFEAGGTLEGWRGRHTVEVDRRKEANRRACRLPLRLEEVT